MTAVDDLLTRYRRAERYFAAEEYTEAARLLDAVVAAAPANLAVRLLLARAAYHSAQLRRAERELHSVLERDPTDDYARLLLGRTLQRMSRDDEAAIQLRLVTALTGEKWDQARGA